MAITIGQCLTVARSFTLHQPSEEILTNYRRIVILKEAFTAKKFIPGGLELGRSALLIFGQFAMTCG